MAWAKARACRDLAKESRRVERAEVSAEDQSSGRQRETDNEDAVAVHRAVKGLNDSRRIRVVQGVENHSDGGADEQKKSDVAPRRRIEPVVKDRGCGHRTDPEGSECRSHKPAVLAQGIFADGVLGRTQVPTETVKGDDRQHECHSPDETHGSKGPDGPGNDRTRQPGRPAGHAGTMTPFRLAPTHIHVPAPRSSGLRPPKPSCSPSIPANPSCLRKRRRRLGEPGRCPADTSSGPSAGDLIVSGRRSAQRPAAADQRGVRDPWIGPVSGGSYLPRGRRLPSLPAT